ncbi:hypothetical protein PsYK624_161950 [Phanerochaete sordida]|uniref:F-box domain-containing protein n=1 Tax=Phanerochaete sordida TaxID=48140 RepID=A0A9P3GQI9_9APHY|nr:hypothetical protein PsYK624_161950 [Phanerochaete sordida]
MMSLSAIWQSPELSPKRHTTRETTPTVPVSAMINDMLPVEVFDDIFNFVRVEDERAHTDKQTIFACSRVSKPWCSLTLRHRFYSVSLFARTEHPHEQWILKRCFLQDFVRSPVFLVVKTYIQRLTVRWGITHIHPYIGADLPQHLLFFPALRSLKLRGLLGKRIPAPPPSMPIILDSLSVEGWVCHGRPHDSRVLCDLLRCFRSVGKLHLEDIKEWLPVSDYSTPQDIHPRVSSLVFRDSTCPRAICDALQAAVARERPLRQLDMRALSFANASDGIELMKAFAHTIEDLKCTMPSTNATASIYPVIPPFDFSTLRHLQSLTLAIELPLSRARRAHSLAGGEDLARASPLARAISSLDTLRTRARTGPLTLLDVQLVPNRQLTDKTQTGDALLDVLRRDDASVRAFEAEVLGLVNEGCVRLVRLGVYSAPPASGLGEGCRHACEEELVTMFPALRRLGIFIV